MCFSAHNQNSAFCLGLLIMVKIKQALLTLKWHLLFQATYYPGLCEPTTQGGLGFDYFLNLSASEMWLSFLENTPDHEWSMSKVVIWLSDVISASNEICCCFVNYLSNHFLSSSFKIYWTWFYHVDCQHISGQWAIFW